MKSSTRNRSRGVGLFPVINTLLLLLVAFITIYPMYYIFIVSVSEGSFVNRGLVKFWPCGFTLGAYNIVFQNSDIWNSYLNTILYTGVGTFINIVMTAMCAYPLSQKSFYGRKFFTKMIIVTMFFGGGLIPTYLVVNNLHLINTMWAIVLPPAINVFNMIVMRTSFESIPDSLREAAFLDGANDIQVLAKIILPLSKPIIATITLFYLVEHWNSFFSAIIYLNEKVKYPVQVILRDIVVAGEFAEEQGEIGSASSAFSVVATNYKYAVIIITVIPILAAYPFLQKYFTKGVMVGAVKG